MEKDVVVVADVIVVGLLFISVTQSGSFSLDVVAVVVVVDVVVMSARDSLGGGGLTVLNMIAFIVSSSAKFGVNPGHHGLTVFVVVLSVVDVVSAPFLLLLVVGWVEIVDVSTTGFNTGDGVVVEIPFLSSFS